MKPPIHFIERRDAGQIKQTACGNQVPLGVFPPRFSAEARLASCYNCARRSVTLTVEQRNEVWDNANHRLEAFRTSPWDAERARQVKADKKAARLAAKRKTSP